MSGSRSRCFFVAHATSKQQMLKRRCFFRCFRFFKSNNFERMKCSVVKRLIEKGVLLLFRIHYTNATKQQMLKL